MPALILEPLEEAPTAPAGDGRLDAGHRADPACPPGKRRRKETEAQAAGRGGARPGNPADGMLSPKADTSRFEGHLNS